MIKKFSKKKTFYLIMTLILAGVIFYASTIKTAGEVQTGLNPSLVYHFGVFFMFTFFLFLTVKKENTKLNLSTVLLVFLISIFYAIFDEIHQIFVPGRFACFKDILIDGSGSLCAILLISQIKKEKIKQPLRRLKII